MEDFVTLEITKKLKEKGFPIKTKTEGKFGLTKVKEVDILPSISQVLKWLREEKAIHLNVVLWEKGWYCVVWCFEYYEEEKKYYYKREYQTNDYNNYEQAAFAGIEYVIDNLI